MITQTTELSKLREGRLLAQQWPLAYTIRYVIRNHACCMCILLAACDQVTSRNGPECTC